MIRPTAIKIGSPLDWVGAAEISHFRPRQCALGDAFLAVARECWKRARKFKVFPAGKETPGGRHLAWHPRAFLSPRTCVFTDWNPQRHLAYSKLRFLRGRGRVSAGGFPLLTRRYARHPRPWRETHPQKWFILRRLSHFCLLRSYKFPLRSILWSQRRTRELSSSGGRRVTRSLRVH